jgi:D-glycero-beta-D-manno-heptose-7-phosphate kinase
MTTSNAINAQTLSAWVTRLAGQRVLIVGDVILDEYVTGKSERLSREAPIPVLEFVSREYIAGGAANPAANIVTLGSAAVQVGIVGDDASATHLRAILAERGIDTSALVTVRDRPTTLKTRVLAQMGLRFPQQVARVDTLSRTAIDPTTQARIIAHLSDQMATTDALLVSDYHNGLLTPALVAAVQDHARAHNVPLFVDAQGALHKYRGYDVVKCNADDAMTALGRDLRTDADFASAVRDLYCDLAITGAMVITRGAEGATLLTDADADAVHCPSPQVRAVYDTVGAGDTSIAVLALARVAGASYVEAVTLANYASGIVVQHVGNYTPSPQELAQAIHTEAPTQNG